MPSPRSCARRKACGNVLAKWLTPLTRRPGARNRWARRAGCKDRPGRSLPAQPVEHDPAVGGAGGRGKREADLLDRLAVEVGNTPVERRFGAGREANRRPVHILQRVAAAIDANAQRNVDRRGIVGIGYDARLQRLAWIDERRRHQVVGAHVDDFGRRESRRRRPRAAQRRAARVAKSPARGFARTAGNSRATAAFISLGAKTPARRPAARSEIARRPSGPAGALAPQAAGRERRADRRCAPRH